MNHLYFRALRSSIYGFLAMAALLFVPAGTLGYWQAFVFMAVFVGASATITVYLAIQDLKPSAVSDLPNSTNSRSLKTTRLQISFYRGIG